LPPQYDIFVFFYAIFVISRRQKCAENRQTWVLQRHFRRDMMSSTGAKSLPVLLFSCATRAERTSEMKDYDTELLTLIREAPDPAEALTLALALILSVAEQPEASR
jgi:hypothetical protein